jgi:6-phosphogluconolactonase
MRDAGRGARDVEVLADLGALSRAAAEHVVRDARDAVRRRGRFTIALAGGSTPRALYELLAGEYRARVDWARTEVFFGDERCVPPDDAASNYAMACDALLGRVPAARVHRIAGERPADDAARAYDAELRAAFPDDRAPTFDVALLGLGADGHTASLFPGDAALEERTAWAVPVPPPESVPPHVERVTVTLPVLDRSRAVYVLAAGGEKRTVVRRILAGEAPALPAARVHGMERTAWLLDRDAAGA